MFPLKSKHLAELVKKTMPLRQAEGIQPDSAEEFDTEDAPLPLVEPACTNEPGELLKNM